MPVGEIIGSKLIKNIHTITSRLFHMKQPGCYYQPMLPLSKKAVFYQHINSMPD